MSDQGYWYNIPSQLVEGGDHIKALIYGLISSLSNKWGVCWATNQFMAGKLGLKSDKVISRRIQELEKEGWINVKHDKPAGNKRYINLCISVCKSDKPSIPKSPTLGMTVPNPMGITIPTSNIKNSNKKSSSNNSSKNLSPTLKTLKEILPLKNNRPSLAQLETLRALVGEHGDDCVIAEAKKYVLWWDEKGKNIKSPVSGLSNWLKQKDKFAGRDMEKASGGLKEIKRPLKSQVNPATLKKLQNLKQKLIGKMGV